MEFLIELISELIIEGSLEACSTKKVPLAVRILLGALLVIIFFGFSIVMLVMGICEGEGALIFSGVLLLLISTWGFINTIKKAKNKNKDGEE